MAPPADRSFADRYPKERGKMLWCIDCGQGYKAEDLDYHQTCPTCVAWWNQNIPPDDPAPAAPEEANR